MPEGLNFVVPEEGEAIGEEIIRILNRARVDKEYCKALHKELTDYLILQGCKDLG